MPADPPVVDSELYQTYLHWIIEHGEGERAYNYPLWLEVYRLDLIQIRDEEPREADLTQRLIDVVDLELAKFGMTDGLPT